ncbi:acetylglutamate synthase Arg6 [Schizosaccharomyces cryophilus OY26]|uniref:Amino-acid acetyltransferase, mitochondrial n=1 Tax=Schizosaccharomyces cryophilus (strain OY26 / ATCC MYA-4695 / CBS 11777 / NBRC 106824 / NRRL Y48691) TaxID=653667 RepID=S9X6G2_SCHCR|nr:acetylglutamate synthase Arg6 [Schizosaccharomyces cryophilus OY26]EPY49331.1 acetylglutamate synthase Arg6 [Schizosaccharomyces cryophilus OY26]
MADVPRTNTFANLSIRSKARMQNPSFLQDLIWILKSVPNKRSTKGFLQKYAPLGLNNASSNLIENKLSYGLQKRIAIAKIADVDSLDDETLYGIGRSIYGLIRLGINTLVVPTGTDLGITAKFKMPAEKQSRWTMLSSLYSQQNRIMRVSDIFTKAGVLTKPWYSSICQLGPNGAYLEDTNSVFRTLASNYTPIIPSLAFMPNLKEISIDGDEVIYGLTKSLHKPEDDYNVDRLIILDKVGGMPCAKRRQGSSHVLINLAQEYEELRKTLPKHHIKNLFLAQRCLKMLSKEASAIVTTPNEAMLTNSSMDRNPLIHNILTERSIFSCSLPRDRSPITKTTLLRAGVPVYICMGTECITDGSVSWERLWMLINDSFNRTLDMEAYLKRLKNSLAAVIVAGDYAGTAIVTYEKVNDGKAKVPYLDKLAVSKNAQGSAAISDVLFNAMIELFPKELIWRSRLDNPVNKWYFERSVGSLKSPKTPWRLFWTGDIQVKNLDHIEHYLNVIDRIQPTWLND